jgi:predicted TIM-barrel fold metal-dependent hydrolase
MIAVDHVTLGCVVDIHTHLGPTAAPGVDDGRSAALLSAMDRAGIDYACLFASSGRGSDYRLETELICGLAGDSGGRLVPFARVHPYWGDDAVEEIHAGAALGARGLKLHPFMDGAFMANDARLVHPLLSAAAEHGLVVLVHSGWGFNSSPGLIADLARSFPDVPVIVGHSGRYGYHREAAAVGSGIGNLYYDVSGLATPEAIDDLVSLVGAERVLFGSDHPYSPIGFEIEKLLRWTRLSFPELAAVAGRNAQRLLGIEFDEAAVRGAPAEVERALAETPA